MSNRENTTADDTKTIAETLKATREFLQAIYDQPDTEDAYEVTDEDEIEAKKLVDLINEWGLMIGL